MNARLTYHFSRLAWHNGRAAACFPKPREAATDKSQVDEVALDA
jgi:hypothetical protein